MNLLYSFTTDLSAAASKAGLALDSTHARTHGISGGINVAYLEHAVPYIIVTLAALWIIWAATRRRTSTELGSV